MAIAKWVTSCCGINDKPAELDTSGPTTVYERKNFEKITVPSQIEGESDIEMWQYQERAVPISDYNAALLASEKMEMRRESEIIDEYTNELIEGGLL
jgi:hypothetical protein